MCDFFAYQQYFTNFCQQSLCPTCKGWGNAQALRADPCSPVCCPVSREAGFVLRSLPCAPWPWDVHRTLTPPRWASLLSPLFWPPQPWSPHFIYHPQMIHIHHSGHLAPILTCKPGAHPPESLSRQAVTLRVTQPWALVPAMPTWSSSCLCRPGTDAYKVLSSPWPGLDFTEPLGDWQDQNYPPILQMKILRLFLLTSARLSDLPQGNQLGNGSDGPQTQVTLLSQSYSESLSVSLTLFWGPPLLLRKVVRNRVS